MNNKIVAAFAGGFILGLIPGIIAGYSMHKRMNPVVTREENVPEKKPEEENQEKVETTDEKEAGPVLGETDYKKFFKEREAYVSDDPNDTEEINDMLNAEQKAAKKNHWKVLGKQPIDPDYPDVEYDQEDIYYFTEDGFYTDDNGGVIDELDLLGPKLKQIGWARTDEEDVWVRNSELEVDYHVSKQFSTREGFFGE